MLTKRIIPVLLIKGGQLIKGKNFDGWRSVGIATQAAKIHAARSVDELLILDIHATPTNQRPNYSFIKTITNDLFSPLTVGGGISTLADIRSLLLSGADKVSISTEAVRRPEFITESSEKFGAQAVVVSIDTDGKTVWSECGKRNHPDLAPIMWAQECADRGAGEILINSIDRDGTMDGFDLKLIEKVSSNVNVPVIACGGCGSYEDMFDAFEAGASAVAVGALFQFTEATPRGAAEYLAEQGLEVRL